MKLGGSLHDVEHTPKGNAFIPILCLQCLSHACDKVLLSLTALGLDFKHLSKRCDAGKLTFVADYNKKNTLPGFPSHIKTLAKGPVSTQLNFSKTMEPSCVAHSPNVDKGSGGGWGYLLCHFGHICLVDLSILGALHTCIGHQLETPHTHTMLKLRLLHQLCCASSLGCGPYKCSVYWKGAIPIR